MSAKKTRQKVGPGRAAKTKTAKPTTTNHLAAQTSLETLLVTAAMISFVGVSAAGMALIYDSSTKAGEIKEFNEFYAKITNDAQAMRFLGDGMAQKYSLRTKIFAAKTAGGCTIILRKYEIEKIISEVDCSKIDDSNSFTLRKRNGKITLTGPEPN